MFDRIEEILSAQWLIHSDTVLNYLTSLIAFLNGKEISAEVFNLDKEKHGAFAVSADSINIAQRWEFNDNNLPENSIAVIPVMGVIMKYGWNGTMSLMRRIREVENNPKISSILFWFETPGGMVNNTDLAAELIAETEMPTVGFVSSMCASAGQWLISGCNKIIASSKIDQFGSIGIKTNVTDINSFLRDKLGMTVKDVYATLSTKKDFEYRQLVDDNNEKPMKAHLDFINAVFHEAIRNNMGIKEKSEVFDAGLYFAEEAIKQGLCHEIGSIDYALQTAYRLGLANKYVKS